MVKVIIDNEYAKSIVISGEWDVEEIETVMSDYGFDGEYHITDGSDERLFAYNPHRYDDTVTITADNIRRGTWLTCGYCNEEFNNDEMYDDKCPYCGKELDD